MTVMDHGPPSSTLQLGRSTLAIVAIMVGLVASCLWAGFLGWCIGWAFAQVIGWVW